MPRKSTQSEIACYYATAHSYPPRAFPDIEHLGTLDGIKRKAWQTFSRQPRGTKLVVYRQDGDNRIRVADRLIGEHNWSNYPG